MDDVPQRLSHLSPARTDIRARLNRTVLPPRMQPDTAAVISEVVDLQPASDGADPQAC